MLPEQQRHVPHARPGQVWRWYPNGEGVFYHCMLLAFTEYYRDYDIWRILDLDSEEAGRVTTAYLFLGMHDNGKSTWKRIT